LDNGINALQKQNIKDMPTTLQTRLQNIITNLQSIATDPTNPIPGKIPGN
jgi:hypothetical protein